MIFIIFKVFLDIHFKCKIHIKYTIFKYYFSIFTLMVNCKKIKWLGLKNPLIIEYFQIQPLL